MNRALPLLMMVIMLFSIPALASPAAQGLPDSKSPISPQTTFYSTEPTSEPDLNLPNRLEPDEPFADGFGSPKLDIGAAMAEDTYSMETRFRLHYLAYRMDAAGSDADRRNILRETEAMYGELILDLRVREMEAAQAYQNGQLSEHELLKELGNIHANAEELEASLHEFSQYVDETPAISFNTEIGIYQSEVTTLQGPIRERTNSIIRGESDPIDIHVTTSEESVTLAMIEGQMYSRETFRADNWDPGGDPQLESLTQAIDRTETLYPWAFSDERGSRSYGEASAAAYRGSSQFSEGSVQIFLDRSTSNVYREYQNLRVDRVEMNRSINTSDNDLTLHIDRTYPGGPAQIRLENANGEPIDGIILVNSRHIGSTGDNGRILLIDPYDTVVISATSRGSTITLTHERSSTESEMVE